MMRFLIDANLPPETARLLVTLGHDAKHTSDLGLERARDRDIWNYAKDNDCCIVTKDEDFVLLRAADPDGPKVVWVRFGNAVRRVTTQRIADVWPAVVDRFEAGDTIVEIR